MKTLIIDFLKKVWQYIRSRSPYVIVIAVLLLLLFLQRECGGKCPDPEVVVKKETVYKEIIKYDTAWLTKIEYQPKWHTRTVYVPEPYALPVDTPAILIDYLSTYVYVDTLMNDSVAYMVVTDHVTKNKIESRTWEYQNRRPTHIYSVTEINIEQPRWNIAVGGFLGGNSSRFDAGVGVIYTSPRTGLYSAGFCPFDKSFRVGMYWNIRKPRR